MGRADFVTDSGRMDDYEFTVTDAYFAVVPGYRDGTDWFLHWVGTTDSDSQPIMDREGYHPSWRLGDGWESIDGGKTVAHPTKKRYNRQTPAGELIDTLVSVTSDDDGNAIFDPDPLDGSDPFKCDWYVGKKFHLVSIEKKYTIDDVERTSERTMPSEYLGEVDESKAAPAPKAAAEAAAPSSVSKGTMAKLKVLAKKSDTFDAFEEGALELEGVVDDGDLLEQVLDQTASGFYASARS